MILLGVGYPRTGTYTLHTACSMLGFKSLHFDAERVPLNPAPGQNWRAYDDVQTVFDMPAAIFYPDLLAAYPDAKAILTVRDPESWFESARWHTAYNAKRLGPGMQRWSRQLARILFGVEDPDPYWWKRRFREHVETVQAAIPADRLTIMNVCGGDGWEVLCPALGVPVPDRPWPHENARPK